MFEMTAVKNKLSSNQKMESIQAQKKLLLTSRVGELVGPTVGLDDGCSKDREQEISCCVSKCDVEVSSKSHEIESTNNSSSLPQPSDLMSAILKAPYLDSVKETSMDS